TTLCCPGVGLSSCCDFCSSAITYPQSASGICWFAVGVTCWARTSSPGTPVAPTSPDALAAPALVCDSPVTDAATMSPLKSESDVTSDVASALACTPLVAVTLVVTELALTIEPSAGYANAPSNATASSGASSSREPT